MLLLLPHQINWIRRLSQEGLNIRQICEVTGFSRGTIRKLLDPKPKQNPRLLETLYDVDQPFFTDKPCRCTRCGAWCYMPCLRCYLHKLRQERGGPAPAPKPPTRFPPGEAM